MILEIQSAAQVIQVDLGLVEAVFRRDKVLEQVPSRGSTGLDRADVRPREVPADIRHAP